MRRETPPRLVPGHRDPRRHGAVPVVDLVNPTSRIQAAAQVGLSVLFLAGYFFMLGLFLLGKIHTPPEWRDQLSILLGVLTSGVLIILNFWFTRERPREVPADA